MKKIMLCAAGLALLAGPAWAQSTATNPTGHVGSGQRSGGPAHENIPAMSPSPSATPQRPRMSPGEPGQQTGGHAREAITTTGGIPRPTKPPSKPYGSGQRAGGPAYDSIPAQKSR